jgi:hypothetical protein
MADTKRLITIQRLAANGTDYDIYYPRTVASQVFYDEANNLTVADHITDTAQIHLTAAARTAMTNYNQATGFAKLDANGFVPTANINPSILAITTEFADIAAMLASTDVEAGQLVWVNDASTDPTVTSGWAIYRKKVGVGIDYTQLAGWTKVSEAEQLDVVVTWDSIQGKPTSTPAQIDQAVTDDHTHANKAQLDLIGFDATTSRPTYNSNLLAYRADVSKVVVADEADAATVVATNSLVEGDQVYLVGGTVTLA